jgi:hypothetical protein
MKKALILMAPVGWVMATFFSVISEMRSSFLRTVRG